MTEHAAMVVLDDAAKSYAGRVAVRSVSFEVRPREMFGLIGPDGAGKTTTLRMVLGLLSPDAGRVRTCGLDPVGQARSLSKRVGYLSQRFSLYGDLSVDENIAFFAEIHGVRGWKPRRDELLELVRMTPFRTRLAERLSGGMKQKLALACTLIHTPELLVLDEPTTGVDPVSRRDFWKLLSRLQQEGLTILMTTPYLDEAERCQRVALIDRGRVLVVDAPGTLRSQATGVMVELLARPKRRALEVLRARPDVGDVQTFGERLHVAMASLPVSSGEATASGLADQLRSAGVDVELARAVPHSLEDIFISRVREAESPASPQEETRG